MTTRERLDRDTVVTHAIALADAEGLDAVTIRGLAADLGVTAMALYWHFKNKDELLDGVADHLLRAVALPEDDSADWAERLRATVAALVAALRPHRALAPLIQPRVLVSDAGLALVEHSLALLAAAGFTPEEAAELSGHILAAAVTLVTAEPGTGGGVDDAAVRAKRASLLSLAPGRFPHVVAAAEPLTWCANGDAYYARGVDLLVAGVRGLRA
ncbi:MAG TPA: TetR/AcrR family transcriptional regulator C-terminal domain-containing protein [Umezawaea sp.]|nr:TetR/AcrR family transcriptional regulator C-terminal domain-containing protein [Umezawaea sp.]